ncbi:LysR family transcriptional regulator [Planctobacterium marinum]|uniref:LysR family transcriptional regulator n=1 Tax=Planctobacterium marinum TaxID=1631968 RepID=UPI001E45FBC0|nr:LysR family transcriptional regulator [Planctobacterium marinum]MCC2605570.1 LysR family transcriptional regulator [Planctobacterium marinum]
MIDELKSLAIFREVARQGSFRSAAHFLHLSPSVISQHISNLEERLATKLLHRTTRKLQLTESGRSLLQHADAMYQHAQTGLALVAQNTGELVGKRVITLPSALLESSWLNGLAEFSRSQTKLNLILEFTDKQLDLLEHNIDLAFRTGRLTDSLMKCKKIGSIARKLVAAPGLLKSHPLPAHIEHLQSFPWVYLDRLPANREFIHKTGNKTTVSINPTITVNSVIAMTELTKKGLGISSPPSHLIQQELQSGSLVEIFPEWKIPDIPLYLVWLDSPENSLLVERLMEYLDNQKTT